jgi:hypothetical protein
MVNLEIVDEQSLQTASGYLHDAAFQRSHVEYDDAVATVTIRLWREIREEMTKQRVFLFLYRWNYLHRECVLKFTNVNSCEITVQDELEYYHVNKLRLDGAHLNIQTACCIKILLNISKLHGSLNDLETTSTNNFSKTTIGF